MTLWVSLAAIVVDMVGKLCQHNAPRGSLQATAVVGAKC